jgi:hypothetical protein
MRSSVIRRLYPRGFHITPVQSDTNSTVTGILGPGRIMGSLLSRTGRQLERVIDRFAEEQLGLGPNAAALRLTAALHDVHVRANPGCRSDHNTEVNLSAHITDRLIWVCNGYCSQCQSAYLPQILAQLPESVHSAVSQMMKYIQYVHGHIYMLVNSSDTFRSSQPPSNIGLAAIYIRLLIQSHVLSPASIQQLDLLIVMQSTRETIWPSYASYSHVPDDLVALKSAIVAVHEASGNEQTIQSNSVIRFELREVGNAETIHALLEQSAHVRCVLECMCGFC